MKIKYLLKGIIMSIPGIELLYNFHKNTGGTDNARYCYSVWMRQLVIAKENGLKSIPKKIVELGPGDSFGIGLSALISGAESYFALDIINYSDAERNLKIFEELVILFKNRTPIPLESEFPNIKPTLESYNFPENIFTKEYLEKVLSEDRLQKIRNSIKGIDNPSAQAADAMIQYRVPWNDVRIIEAESVDMIISQAVLQHVDNLEEIYKCMYQWLKKGGLMSHTIDLKSMGSSDNWDGHWTYSDIEWKIVRGRRNYLINRAPYSTHIKFLKKEGFSITVNQQVVSSSNIASTNKLASRFKTIPEEDLKISGTFIQAIKSIIVLISAYWGKLIQTPVFAPEMESILFLY